MKVWVSTNDYLEEMQTASEHLTGLFKTKRDVVIGMAKQAEFEGYKIEDYSSTDTAIYCVFCWGDNVIAIIEAELTTIK